MKSFDWGSRRFRLVPADFADNTDFNLAVCTISVSVSSNIDYIWGGTYADGNIDEVGGELLAGYNTIGGANGHGKRLTLSWHRA